MDFLAEHRHILRAAVAAIGLPDKIDENSELSLTAARELLDAGFIDGEDVRGFDNSGLLAPSITIAGREYLNELEQRAFVASPAGKLKRYGGLIVAWAAGLLTYVVAAWLLRLLGLNGS